ncbi:MAG: hypothetical protein ACRYF0_01940 [Janthinobacterium lividum]
MATFRVYFRRPTSRPPMWDYATTVVAPNAQVALGRAYENWVQSHPTPPVPPLSQCQSQVNQSGVTSLALSAMSLSAAGMSAAVISPAQQAFIDNIQQQVSNFLATQLDGAFSMVSYPSGFNYGITYGLNGYYNKATLQDIDTLLGTASNGQLDLTSADFASLYAQILQAVTFSFSQQDLQTMNKQDMAASAQVTSVLTAFTDAGGSFSNPLPTIGGKLQDVFNQLTKTYGSLSNLPVTLNALRNAIASYQSLAGNSYALHNRYYAASARVAAAIAAATTPTAANGGMQVDATTYYAGYTPNKLPSANALIGGLSTAGNAVSISISLNSFSSSSSNLSIGGGAGFSFPIAEVIGISVNSSASYDLSRYTSSSSAVTMDITYPGVTMFPSTPSVLSADNSTGWYANDILQEVVAKTGQDATGYQLQGSEFNIGETFGIGKAFSRLKTFVISQQPTIKMTMTGVDTSKVTSDFQQHNKVSIDLLGLFTIGSASSNYSVQKVDASSEAGTVTITFGPPQVSGTLSPEQQVAYVLGGVASYPPDNI